MNATVLGIVVVGSAVVYAIAGVLIVRKLQKGKVLEGHNDVLSPVFATAGVIYAVLLGFLVVAVWQSYDDAKGTIQDEATSLTTLYRLTAGMRHPEERAAMRSAIRVYTEAVINDEWKTQAVTGTASPQTRKAMGSIYHQFSVMPLNESGSQVNGEFLRTASQITIDRNRRIVEATEHLSWVMWLGLFVGGFVVVGMTCILYMEAAWPHVVITGVLAALIGTLLFVTMVLDHPFVGPLALDSSPLEYAVTLYDSVDAGS
jgi:uncharacterized membrane protein YdcZ (DUF606 family)